MAITKNGYALTTSNDYLVKIVEQLNAEFPNMSNASNNFSIVLSRILANILEENDAIRAEGYNNVYVATAFGNHLDKAVSIAGIERRHGTQSFGKALFYKTSDVPIISIAPNTILESGDIKYYTTNEDYVPINSLTPVEIEIASYETGRDKNLTENSILTPVISIRGLKEIKCEKGTFGGTDTETDQELRRRYYVTISSYSNSSLNGIISEIAKIDNVIRVSGIENNTDIQSSEGLPPHSFELFIEGGSDAEIAEGIFFKKPAGIQTHGKVRHPITYQGSEYQISFSRYEKQAVYYSLHIQPKIGASAINIERDVKKALVDYSEKNNKIGHSTLVGYLFNNVDGIGVIKSVKFGLTQSPTQDTPLVAGVGKAFTTDDSKVNIVFESGGI